MGTAYPNPAGKDLYTFLGDRLAETINEDLKKNKSKLLINLASQEYFKAARGNKIDAEVVAPVFKDEKNGKFKIISFYAKKARGYMSSFLVRNRVDSLEGIRDFNEHGYELSVKDSTDSNQYFSTKERNRIAA